MSAIKGLTDEEWTDAALESLTDEALTQIVRVAAMLFSKVRKEAIRRGMWEDLITKVKV